MIHSSCHTLHPLYFLAQLTLLRIIRFLANLQCLKLGECEALERQRDVLRASALPLRHRRDQLEVVVDHGHEVLGADKVGSINVNYKLFECSVIDSINNRLIEHSNRMNLTLEICTSNSTMSAPAATAFFREAMEFSRMLEQLRKEKVC